MAESDERIRHRVVRTVVRVGKVKLLSLPSRGAAGFVRRRAKNIFASFGLISLTTLIEAIGANVHQSGVGILPGWYAGVAVLAVG
jgi:hypothetical protein